MRFSQRQMAMIFIGVLVMGLTFFLIFTNLDPKSGGSGAFNIPDEKRTPIVIWGVDSSSAFGKIIENYEKIRPAFKVNYRQLSAFNFEEQVVNAMAAGVGPDIIMVKNRSLGPLLSKLSPAPASVINISTLRQIFPTVVEQDFTQGQGSVIYALPLYMDTLAFVYNRDALDRAGIITFPKTWSELLNIVPKLKSVDERGRITQAAIALGGSDKTVVNGSDLLSLLFLQSGMSLQGGDLDIGDSGERMFDFYLQFSRPTSPFYTWDESQPTSLDAFASRRVAMAAFYLSQLDSIKQRNPFATYLVAPMIQFNEGAPVNYADYWGLAVTKQNKAGGAAWDFVNYATVQPVNAALYAQATGRLPALKALIEERFEDPVKGVYARQALTARSWPSPNDKGVRQSLSQAVADVLAGRMNARDALSRAELQIGALFRAF